MINLNLVKTTRQAVSTVSTTISSIEVAAEMMHDELKIAQVKQRARHEVTKAHAPKLAKLEALRDLKETLDDLEVKPDEIETLTATLNSLS